MTKPIEVIKNGNLNIQSGTHIIVCIHYQCEKCNGTHRDKPGNVCIHSFNCVCPRCSPYKLTLK